MTIVANIKNSFQQNDVIVETDGNKKKIQLYEEIPVKVIYEPESTFIMVEEGRLFPKQPSPLVLPPVMVQPSKTAVPPKLLLLITLLPLPCRMVTWVVQLRWLRAVSPPAKPP